MTVPGLAVTEADGVLTIRFDRPEAFNALTGEMTLGTAELLERASARDDVRVVVLTGTGPRVQHRRRHRGGGRPRALRHPRPGRREPAGPGDHRLRQAGGGRGQRHRRRRRAVRCAGLRPHRLRGVVGAAARLRPGRADARRRCDRQRGRVDRPGPGDAAGAAGRAAAGAGGVRRGAGLARRRRRGLRGRAGEGGEAAAARRPAGPGGHEAGDQRGRVRRSSTPRWSSSGPPRRCCCAPPTSPRACAPSPRSAIPPSPATDEVCVLARRGVTYGRSNSVVACRSELRSESCAHVDARSHTSAARTDTSARKNTHFGTQELHFGGVRW